MAPEVRKSTYVRALHRACVILGGLQQLAEFVGVQEAVAAAWLQGAQEPPYEAFLVAVEVILLNLDAPGPAN